MSSLLSIIQDVPSTPEVESKPSATLSVIILLGCPPSKKRPLDISLTHRGLVVPSCFLTFAMIIFSFYDRFSCIIRSKVSRSTSRIYRCICCTLQIFTGNFYTFTLNKFVRGLFTHHYVLMSQLKVTGHLIPRVRKIVYLC